MLSSSTASAPCSSASFEFLERAHFDLDHLRAAAVPQGALQRRHHAARERNVVVLDQHAVAEIEPMVGAAAAAHRPLVEHAQSGRGLARIQNGCLGAGDRVHVLACQRGDAAHALHDVQDHALAGENHARIVHDDGNRLSLAQAHAIKDFGMAE